MERITVSAGATMPLGVLICVNDGDVSELIRLLLIDAGYAAASLDLYAWFEGITRPDPSPDILLLDAWPLRHPDMARRALAQLTVQSARLILLIDGQQAAQLADDLGATATLQLMFTRDELIMAVQQAGMAVPAPSPVSLR
jgi:hypothetical protein